MALAFVIILAICLGGEITILLDHLAHDEFLEADHTFILILIIILSLVLNTILVVRELNHYNVKRVEVTELPQIDTLVTTHGQEFTKTYILDFTTLPQPPKKYK